MSTTFKVLSAKKVVSSYKIESGDLLTIEARDKSNYQLIDDKTGLGPQNIIAKRDGYDLTLFLENGDMVPDIIIKGYYGDENGENVTNLIVGEHENGNMYAYVPESGEKEDAVSMLQDQDAEPQALGGNELASPFWAFSPWWLLALVPLAAAALIGRGGKNTDEPPSAPMVKASDTDGSVKITPPADPDVKSLKVEYIDEKDQPQTLIATKGENGWDIPQAAKERGITIDPTSGQIFLPQDEVKDGSEVKARATDNAGQEGEEGKDTTGIDSRDAQVAPVGFDPNDPSKSGVSSTSSVNEGSSVVTTVKLTTNNGADRISVARTQDSATDADFDLAQETYSNGVTKNADGTLNVPAGVTEFAIITPVRADAVSEGPETLNWIVGGVPGNKVTINDTSMTPTPVAPAPVAPTDLEPGAPMVKASNTDGSVTINPPADNDLKSLKVEYTDEKDQPQTVVAMKGPNGWDIPQDAKDKGITIDPTSGQIYLPQDEVKDLSEVKARATDEIGQEGPEGKDTTGEDSRNNRVLDSHSGVVSAPSSVNEGNNIVTTVKLVNNNGVDNLPVARTQDSATDADFDLANETYTNGVTKNADGTLNVPAGVTEFAIITPVKADAKAEGAETLNWIIGNVPGNKVTINDTSFVLPNSPTVVGAEDGTVTIEPPKGPNAEEVESITIKYVNEAGEPKTVVATKGENGWEITPNQEGITVDPTTGKVFIPATGVEDGSIVEAFVTDKFGYDSMPSRDTVARIPADNGDGKLNGDDDGPMIKIPKTLPLPPKNTGNKPEIFFPEDTNNDGILNGKEVGSDKETPVYITLPGNPDAKPKAGDKVVVEINGNPQEIVLTEKEIEAGYIKLNVPVDGVENIEVNAKLVDAETGNETPADPRTVVVDTVAPSKPDVVAKPTGEVEIDLPEDAEVGDMVEIIFTPEGAKAPVKVVLTKDPDGNWTSSRPDLIEDVPMGEKAVIPEEKVKDNSPVTAVSTDPVGNRSEPDTDIAKGPQQPEVLPEENLSDKPTITFGEDTNKDDRLNAAEVGNDGKTPVHVSIPKGANPQPGDKVVVTINGEPQEIVLTDDDIEKGYVTFEAPVSPETEEVEVKAKLTDPNGQDKSPEITKKIDVDVVAPSKPDVVAKPNGEVEINLPKDAKSGDSVKVLFTPKGETEPKEVVLTKQPGGEWTSSNPDLIPDVAAGEPAVIPAKNVEPETEVVAFAEDPFGNTSEPDVDTAIEPEYIEVQTHTDGKPNVVFLEDGNQDGYINIEEIDDRDGEETTPVSITVPRNTLAGDKVLISVNGEALEPHVLTEEDVAQGYITKDLPVDLALAREEEGQKFVVEAQVVAPKGKSLVGDASAIVDLLKPAEFDRDPETIDSSLPNHLKPEGMPKNPIIPGKGEIPLTTNGAPTIFFPEDKNPEDGKLNVKELGSDSSTPVGVTIPENSFPGDTLLVTINDKLHKVPVTAENKKVGYIEIPVPTNDLPEVPNEEGEDRTGIKVTAKVVRPSGNESREAEAKVLVIDRNVPSDEIAISFPEDTADPKGTLNAAEVGSDSKTPIRVAIPTDGTVVKGDQVLLSVEDVVNGVKQPVVTYPIDITQADLDNGYLEVDHPVTNATTAINAKAKVVDFAKNESKEISESVKVDFGVDNTVPTLEIPEAGNGVQEEELADGIQAKVTPPVGSEPGDWILVELTGPDGEKVVVDRPIPRDWTPGQAVNVTIPKADLPADVEDFVAKARVEDSAGNVSKDSNPVPVKLDPAPDAPTVTASTTDGSVTIVPPTDPKHNDVTKLHVEYTDEQDQPQAFTATKVGNVWTLPQDAKDKGITIDPTSGQITLPQDAVKDGSTVKAKAEDKAGQLSKAEGKATAGIDDPNARPLPEDPNNPNGPDNPNSGVASAPLSVNEGNNIVTTVKLTNNNGARNLSVERTQTSATDDDFDLAKETYTNGVTKNADGTLNVPAGVTEFAIITPVKEDASVDEGDETVKWTIGGVVGNEVTIKDTSTDPLPGEPTVLASKTDGSATILPPTDPDVKAVKVDYIDEAGNPQTVEATKGPNGWDIPQAAKEKDITIDPTSGQIFLPQDEVKDGSEVKATATDEAGQEGPEGKGTVGEDSKDAGVKPKGFDPNDLSKSGVSSTESVNEGENIITTVKLTNNNGSDSLPMARSQDSATDADLNLAKETYSHGVTKNADGTLNVPKGVTEFTITTPVVADNAREGEETLKWIIGGVDGNNVTINDTSKTLDKPSLTIPEMADGYVTPNDMEDGIQAEVVPPKGTKPGDTVVVTLKDENGEPVLANGQPITAEAPVPADWKEGTPVIVTIPTAVLPKDEKGNPVNTTYKPTAKVLDETGHPSQESDPADVKIETRIPGNSFPDNVLDEKDTDENTLNGGPRITFPEDNNPKDGRLNATELGGDDETPVRISIPTGSKPGDTLVVDINGKIHEIPVTTYNEPKPKGEGFVIIPVKTDNLPPVSNDADEDRGGIQVKAKVVTPAGLESKETVADLLVVDKNVPNDDVTIEFPEDTDKPDGLLNAKEIGADLKTPIRVTFATDGTVVVGDTVEVAVNNIVGGKRTPTVNYAPVITEEDLANGYVTVDHPVTRDVSKIEASAQIVDFAKNKSQPVNESVKVDFGVDGTKPVLSIPEAVDKVLEEELKDGIQTLVTPPVGSEPGDVIEVELKDENGQPVMDEFGNPITVEAPIPENWVPNKAVVVTIPRAVLPEDMLDFKPTAKVKDTVGNVSNDSNAVDVTLDPAPAAPTLTLSETDGSITIAPPKDEDLKSMTVNYQDENGSKQTLVATKGNEGWDIPQAAKDKGITIDPESGLITLPQDQVKSKTEVVAKATDNANQDSPFAREIASVDSRNAETLTVVSSTPVNEGEKVVTTVTLTNNNGVDNLPIRIEGVEGKNPTDENDFDTPVVKFTKDRITSILLPNDEGNYDIPAGVIEFTVEHLAKADNRSEGPETARVVVGEKAGNEVIVNDTSITAEKPLFDIPEAADGYVTPDDLANGIQTTVTPPPGFNPGDTIVIELKDDKGLPVVDEDRNPIKVEAKIPEGWTEGTPVPVTIPTDVLPKDPEGNVIDGLYRPTAKVVNPQGVESKLSDPTPMNVDTRKPDLVGIVFNDDEVPKDELLNKTEVEKGAKDTTPVTFTLPDNAKAGDTLIYTVDGGEEKEIELTPTHIAAKEVALPEEVPVTATTEQIAVTAKLVTPAGNQSDDAEKTVKVNVNAAPAPEISFPEDTDLPKGILNAKEIGTDKSTPISVKMSNETKVGDILVMTVDGNPVGETHTVSGKNVVGVKVTQTMLDNNNTYIMEHPVTVDTKKIEVTAKVISAIGNESLSDNESIEVDYKTPGDSKTGTNAGDGKADHGPTLRIPEMDDGYITEKDMIDGEVVVKVTPPVNSEPGDKIVITLKDRDGNVFTDNDGKELPIFVEGMVPKSWTEGQEVDVAIPVEFFNKRPNGLPKDETYQATAKVIDPAGNESLDSNASPIVIELRKPGDVNNDGRITTSDDSPEKVTLPNGVQVPRTENGAPTIAFVEDKSPKDGILSKAELGDDKQTPIYVTVPEQSKAGDTLVYTVNGEEKTPITLSQADIDNKYVKLPDEVPVSETTASITATAQIVTPAKNTSAKAEETVRISTLSPEKPTIEAPADGSITVKVPIKTRDLKDPRVLELEYTDNDGQKHNLTLTKGTDGLWRLEGHTGEVQVEPEKGYVYIPEDQVKDLSPVKALVKNSLGNESEVTTETAKDPMPNAPKVEPVPNEGGVTITPPKEGTDWDVNKVKITELTDEAGNPVKATNGQPIEATKDEQGVWSISPNDKGITVDPTTGVISIPQDSVKDGSTVTAQAVDKSNQVADGSGVAGNDLKDARPTSIVSSPDPVNEGQTITTTIKLDNTNNGVDNLRIEIGGVAGSTDGVDANDFQGNPTVTYNKDGQPVVINPNQDGTYDVPRGVQEIQVQHAVREDRLTEGPEKAVVTATAGTTVLTGNTITVNDTSLDVPLAPTVAPVPGSGAVTITPPKGTPSKSVTITALTDEDDQPVVGTDGQPIKATNDNGTWTISPNNHGITVDPTTGVITIPQDSVKDGSTVKAKATNVSGDLGPEGSGIAGEDSRDALALPQHIVSSESVEEGEILTTTVKLSTNNGADDVAIKPVGTGEFPTEDADFGPQVVKAIDKAGKVTVLDAKENGNYDIPKGSTNLIIENPTLKDIKTEGEETVKLSVGGVEGNVATVIDTSTRAGTPLIKIGEGEDDLVYHESDGENVSEAVKNLEFLVDNDYKKEVDNEAGKIKLVTVTVPKDVEVGDILKLETKVGTGYIGEKDDKHIKYKENEEIEYRDNGTLADIVVTEEMKREMMEKADADPNYVGKEIELPLTVNTPMHNETVKVTAQVFRQHNGELVDVSDLGVDTAYRDIRSDVKVLIGGYVVRTDPVTNAKQILPYDYNDRLPDDKLMSYKQQYITRDEKGLYIQTFVEAKGKENPAILDKPFLIVNAEAGGINGDTVDVTFILPADAKAGDIISSQIFRISDIDERTGQTRQEVKALNKVVLSQEDIEAGVYTVKDVDIFPNNGSQVFVKATLLDRLNNEGFLLTKSIYDQFREKGLTAKDIAGLTSQQILQQYDGSWARKLVQADVGFSVEIEETPKLTLTVSSRDGLNASNNVGDVLPAVARGKQLIYHLQAESRFTASTSFRVRIDLGQDLTGQDIALVDLPNSANITSTYVVEDNQVYVDILSRSPRTGLDLSFGLQIKNDKVLTSNTLIKSNLLATEDQVLNGKSIYEFDIEGSTTQSVVLGESGKALISTENDDQFVIGNVAPSVVIDGGLGNDTVQLNAEQYSMRNFKDIEFFDLSNTKSQHLDIKVVDLFQSSTEKFYIYGGHNDVVDLGGNNDTGASSDSSAYLVDNSGLFNGSWVKQAETENHSGKTYDIYRYVSQSQSSKLYEVAIEQGILVL